MAHSAWEIFASVFQYVAKLHDLKEQWKFRAVNLSCTFIERKLCAHIGNCVDGRQCSMYWPSFMSNCIDRTNLPAILHKRGNPLFIRLAWYRQYNKISYKTPVYSQLQLGRASYGIYHLLSGISTAAWIRWSYWKYTDAFGPSKMTDSTVFSNNAWIFPVQIFPSNVLFYISRCQCSCVSVYR